MRTSSTITAVSAMLLASSAVVLAHRGSEPNLLSRRAELSKLAARRAISEGAFDAFLDKRGEAWGREVNGPEECGDDEEWVPYQQNNVVDNKQEEKPVEKEQPKKEDTDVPPQETPAPVLTPASGVTTPDNTSVLKARLRQVLLGADVFVYHSGSPEGTYTVEEGCTLYHNVVAGDICLGLLDIAHQQGFGTTLEELYCLNPAIDELCYNLQIDNSYCIAYSNGTTTLPLPQR